MIECVWFDSCNDLCILHHEHILDKKKIENRETGKTGGKTKMKPGKMKWKNTQTDTGVYFCYCDKTKWTTDDNDNKEKKVTNNNR